MGLLCPLVYVATRKRVCALCQKSRTRTPHPLNSRQSPISGINRHPGAFTHACYGSGAFYVQRRCDGHFLQELLGTT